MPRRVIKEPDPLSAGLHSHEEIEVLLSLTKIESESIIGALFDHLVRGFSIQEASTINGATRPNVSVNLAALNEVARKVERVNELKYSKVV